MMEIVTSIVCFSLISVSRRRKCNDYQKLLKKDPEFHYFNEYENTLLHKPVNKCQKSGN